MEKGPLILASHALHGPPHRVSHYSTGQVPELRLLVRCARFRLLTAFLLFTFPSKVFLFLEQQPRYLGECRECMVCLGLGLGLELELRWPAWLQLRQWWLQLHWLEVWPWDRGGWVEERLCILVSIGGHNWRGRDLLLLLFSSRPSFGEPHST